MADVLVYVETANGEIRSASLPAITAARELAQHHGGGVTAVIAGATIGSAATEAARYCDRVMVYDDPALAAVLAETHAAVLAAAMMETGAGALVATASSTGKDVLPRVAALLAAGMASDVIRVKGARSFRRPAYAGNALADIEVLTPIVVASIRQTEFAAAAPAASVGTIEPHAAIPVDAQGAEILGLHTTKSARPDLSEAAVVVSGGRGMRAAENFKILEELTDLLGGALGASRAACDAGMVPNDLQVGQTGKIVAPKLYIAVAISGAIQHLAGMKGSKVIVAINKNADEPIFQVADYGLVATWEQAVPALIAEVRKLKNS
jgi:electron transfer flavoprotein alpha subunit